MLSWQIFSHYLLSRRAGALIRTVSWIAMIGIAVGVAALIIVISVMNGFNQVIRDRHIRAEPHLVVHAPKQVSSRDWLEAADPELRKLIGKELSDLTPFMRQDVILKTMDGYFAGAEARGLEEASIESFMKRLDDRPRRHALDVQVTEPERESAKLGPDDILIGAELGEALRLIPGDRLVLISPEALLLPADEAPPLQTVNVKGFFSSQLADVDGKLVLFNRRDGLQSLRNNASLELGFEVFLNQANQYEKPLKRLREAGWQVESWPERNSALFFALKMEKLAMTIFLTLSAVITSFSILTVLILLVTQKRRDIGILMAMGLNRARTRKVFAGVGIWLSGLGLLAGLVIGVGTCLTLDHFPIEILPAIYYDRTIPAKVSPFMIAIVLVVASVLAALGAWFPALMSARGSPAEALRGSTKEL